MKQILATLLLIICTSTIFAQTELGLARQISAITDNQNGTATATVTYTVQNFGVLPISNLQITDDFQSQYAGASIIGVGNITVAGFFFDPTFNGTTNTNILLPGNTLTGGTTRTITLDVTVRPADDQMHTYSGNATASGIYNGTNVSDVSQSGIVPDANANGNPLDDGQPSVTSWRLFGTPALEVTFYPGATSYSGSGNIYNTTYGVNISNLGGNTTIINDPLIDFTTVFPSGFTVTGTSYQAGSGSAADLNPAFNGDSDTHLLNPNTALSSGGNVVYRINLQVDASTGGPWFFAGGVMSSSIPAVTTYSTNASLLSPNPSGAPSAPPGRPAAVLLTQTVKVGNSWELTSITQTGPTAYSVTYRLHVKAYGSGLATNVREQLIINRFEGKCNNFTFVSAVPVTPIGTLSINPSFNGIETAFNAAGPQTYFISGGTLNGGDEAIYDLTWNMQLEPGQLHLNYGRAYNDTPSGLSITDNIVDGQNPDPDSNNDPTDNENGSYFVTPGAGGNSHLKPALSVTDLNGGTVQPGDVLEYTLQIQNNSGIPATNVIATLPIDSRLTIVPNSVQYSGADGSNTGIKTDSSGDDQSNYSTGTYTFYAGSGATAGTGGTIIGINHGDWNYQVVRFRATVNTGIAPGTVIPLQATVTSGTQASVVSSNLPFDAASEIYSCTNNPPAFDPTPVVIGPIPQIQVSKQMTDVNGGTPNPGDVIHVTLTGANTSAIDGAANAAIEDQVPINTSYVPGSLKIAGITLTDALADDNGYFLNGTSVVHFNIGTGATPTGGGLLSPGAMHVVEFDVQINSGVTPGTVLSNTAVLSTVYGNTPSRDQISGIISPTTITVEAPPSLIQVKTVTDDNGGTLLAGETITWTITITNAAGAGRATKVVLTDAVPANTTYVANSTKIGGTTYTDTPGDDLVDVVGSNLTLRLGTGATSTTGGELAPGTSLNFSFQTTVNAGTPGGTVIPNQSSVTSNDNPIALGSSPSLGAPEGPTTITTAAPAFGNVLLGTQNHAEATGPTSNNDDYTNKSTTTGISIAPGGVTTSAATVIFTNTLQNMGSVADSYQISAPTIPSGATVVVTIAGTPTDITTAGTYATTPSIPTNGTYDITVDVTIPAGQAVLSGFSTILQATSVGDSSKTNQTIDRVYTGYIQMTKSVTTANGTEIGGPTDTVSGSVLTYSVVAVNLSSSGGTNSISLPANNLVITEDGNLAPNNWGTWTNHVPANAQILPSGSVSGDVAGSNLLTATIPTLAPGASATFIFKRTIK